MKGWKANIQRQQLLSGFDGVYCKDFAAISSDGEKVFMSWGMLKLTDSDRAWNGQYTVGVNNGESFYEPEDFSSITRQEENGNIIYSFWRDEECYSKKYDTFFTLGYEDKSYINSIAPEFVARAMYQLRDGKTLQSIGEPKELPFPITTSNYIIPHGQPYEYENGDFLFTFYYNGVNGKGRIISVRYSFDGEEFAVVEAGQAIVMDSLQRGCSEASVAKLGDKYYMTIRSNENAYLAWSDDGLNYSDPVLWRFNNGSILGSCNTQQRWIRHQGALFLVYTRANGSNNHVMRNRAPLYMAQFDEEKKCLIKETEIELVPNRGASVGTMIGVCEVSSNESYVMVIENMQPDWQYGTDNWQHVAQYGADNSIWLIKITTEESDDDPTVNDSPNKPTEPYVVPFGNFTKHSLYNGGVMYDILASHNQIQVIQDLINYGNGLAVMISGNSWALLKEYAKTTGYTKIVLTVTSNASVGYTKGSTPDGKHSLIGEDYKFTKGETARYERYLADYENLNELLVIYLSTTQAQAYGQAQVNQDFRILVTLEA